ncbi:MAG: hypothetical protein MHM6MM_006090 [Cercozoa sp. M6MM]
MLSAKTARAAGAQKRGMATAWSLYTMNTTQVHEQELMVHLPGLESMRAMEHEFSQRWKVGHVLYLNTQHDQERAASLLAAAGVHALPFTQRYVKSDTTSLVPRWQWSVFHEDKQVRGEAQNPRNWNTMVTDDKGTPFEAAKFRLEDEAMPLFEKFGKREDTVFDDLRDILVDKALKEVTPEMEAARAKNSEMWKTQYEWDQDERLVSMVNDVPEAPSMACNVSWHNLLADGFGKVIMLWEFLSPYGPLELLRTANELEEVFQRYDELVGFVPNTHVDINAIEEDVARGSGTELTLQNRINLQPPLKSASEALPLRISDAITIDNVDVLRHENVGISECTISALRWMNKYELLDNFWDLIAMFRYLNSLNLECTNVEVSTAHDLSPQAQDLLRNALTKKLALPHRPYVFVRFVKSSMLGGGLEMKVTPAADGETYFFGSSLELHDEHILERKLQSVPGFQLSILEQTRRHWVGAPDMIAARDRSAEFAAKLETARARAGDWDCEEFYQAVKETFEQLSDQGLRGVKTIDPLTLAVKDFENVSLEDVHEVDIAPALTGQSAQWLSRDDPEGVVESESPGKQLPEPGMEAEWSQLKIQQAVRKALGKVEEQLKLTKFKHPTGTNLFFETQQALLDCERMLHEKEGFSLFEKASKSDIVATPHMVPTLHEVVEHLFDDAVEKGLLPAEQVDDAVQVAIMSDKDLFNEYKRELSVAAVKEAVLEDAELAELFTELVETGVAVSEADAAEMLAAELLDKVFGAAAADNTCVDSIMGAGVAKKLVDEEKSQPE